MKIAISATGADLGAQVDPRFGRCRYFILVSPDTMEFESVENSSIMASGGAGIATAQMVAGKGAKVVLTGNCGPNANQVLSAAGIQIVTGVSGKVTAAIQDYKAGESQGSPPDNKPSNFGRGKGMGKGIGQCLGAGITPPMSQATEVQTLKAQSQALAQQLTSIQRRIEALEKKGM